MTTLRECIEQYEAAMAAKRTALTARGTSVGAARLGMDADEYRAKRDAGLRWCFGHQAWERLHDEDGHLRFYVNVFRPGGYDSQCKDHARQYAREYQRRKRAAAREGGN